MLLGDLWGKEKVFRFTLDSFYSSSDQPHMKPKEASDGLWVRPQHTCDHAVPGTMGTEAWLCSPGAHWGFLFVLLSV